MRNSGICGEIRENKIYPENQEKTACVEYATVFSPPEQLQIPPNPNKVSSMTDSTLSVNSNSDETSKLDSPMEGSYRVAPDLSGIRMNTDSISSSAAITPVTKNLPKTSQNEENSVQPTLSESSIEIHINNEKQSNQSSENNAHLSPSLFEQMGDD
ncbi:unnamed protein product, partial [Rotaria magnacalcarata]